MKLTFMTIFFTSLIISPMAFAFAFDFQKLGSTKSSEVHFSKGLAGLDEDTKTKIRTAVEEARTLAPISEVKVLSWADREYPVQGEKASKESVKLADARSEAIKRYLRELNVNGAHAYNMAARPNVFQEMLKTSQAKVKDTLERTVESPADGNSSTSAVLIYTSGNPNKL